MYKPEDNSAGFTQFINDLQECTDVTTGNVKPGTTCQCDIGIADFRENVQRVEQVDLVAPFLYDGLAVVTHVDNTSIKTSMPFFLAAFEPAVWIAIVGLVIAFTVLKLLDNCFLENTPTSDVWNTSRTNRSGDVFASFC